MKTLSSVAMWAALVILPAISTITPADTIPSLLEKYVAEYPVEKVYVHTDRKYYAPGEAIWLKSYTVAGSLNQPSPISNNIHVELISPDKSLVKSALLYSEEGFSNGNFVLPDSIKNGTYLIRAYTSWMRNFGENYFFEKEIEVLGGMEADIIPAKNEQSKVQILPEGGQLVEGIPSRVAIYSDIDAFELVDNQGNKLSDVSISHNKMGLFGITPQPGIQYNLRDKEGNQYALPQTLKTGFSIEARPNLKDQVKITLRSNAATADKEKMLLLVHSGGLISYALDIDLSNQVSILNLPKQNMPEGISHITLFNKDEMPVAERLVFVKKEGLVNGTLQPDKTTYADRDKVSVGITVKDLNGNPLKGNFSLAALDVAQLPSVSINDHIKSNLLLSADLKGKIENPAYYFSEDSPEVNQNLDLLMMTKGWSRFTWQDVLEENYPSVQYLIEKGINVKGRIIDKFNEKPIEKGKITYFDNQMNPPLIDQVEANDEGFFTINNIAAYTDHIVTFQGANKKGRGQQYIGFEIHDSVYYEQPNLWSAPANQIPEQIGDFVEKSKERALIDESYDFDTTATRLDDVVVEGLRNTISQELSAYGAGDVTFSYEDIKTGQKAGRTPLDIIQGKVAGVQVTGMGFSQSVVVRGGMSGFSDGAPPAFYLNDVPTDLETLLAIPATAVERVEIFKGPSAAIFGANGATGVLAFYTYQGGAYQKPTEGMYTTVIKNAYQGKREFFAPDYSEDLPEHIKPDHRVLVHWEPTITTDENGKATVEFYTTDLETTIQLDLQGITMNGKPIATTALIEVEK